MGILYAAPEDMTRVVVSAALSKIVTDDRVKFLQDASDEFSSELNSRYTLPLIAWGQDLRRNVATVSVYEALSMRGFDTGDQGSSLLRRAQLAREWIKRVGKGELSPPDIIDSTVGIDESSPVIVTSPRRDRL